VSRKTECKKERGREREHAFRARAKAKEERTRDRYGDRTTNTGQRHTHARVQSRASGAALGRMGCAQPARGVQADLCAKRPPRLPAQSVPRTPPAPLLPRPPSAAHLARHQGAGLPPWWRMAAAGYTSSLFGTPGLNFWV
jgi:hypothetical protein